MIENKKRIQKRYTIMFEPVSQKILSTTFTDVETAVSAINGNLDEVTVYGMKKTCRNPYTGRINAVWSSYGASTYYEDGDTCMVASEEGMSAGDAYSVQTPTGYKTIAPWFDMETGDQVGWRVVGP